MQIGHTLPSSTMHLGSGECPSSSAGPVPDFGDRLEARAVERFGDGAGNFIPPTPEEAAAFQRMLTDARRARSQAELGAARREAGALGFQIEETGNCRVVREADGQGRGWGTVVLHPESRSDLVVEIPHPGFDRGTPQMGWQAFQEFDAAALIVAGAVRGNRREKSPEVPTDHGQAAPGAYDPWKHAAGVPDYSLSDPTHSRATAFHAAHQALTGPTSVVLQIHGFSAWKHHQEEAEFPADEQVVLTDCADDRYDPPHLQAAQTALQSAGFRSHVVSFETPALSHLGAVVNVQRLDMAERGLVGRGRDAEMVHLELDASLRKGADRDQQFSRVLDALRPVFR